MGESVKKYFDMLRAVKDTSMATVAADGTPRVRIIDTMIVEDEKLYFLTARGKDFYDELMQTGKVAVTALNDEWETVRLWGSVKNVGQELLPRIFKENPSMNNVYPGFTREILEVFCLYEGEGEYFCLAQEPIVRHPFAFGRPNAEDYRKKGFLITDSCVQCGTCAGVCPQETIEVGTPFHIVQEHCLHCGNCFEQCPVQAIRRRDEMDMEE